MSGGEAEDSIPSDVRKVIQNIKEATRNHSEDEIYAMLRECNMDPDDTAQRLLLEDPFHEVKRKHRKKENTNRESGDSRWRPGTRGSRGGRVNASLRYTSHDAGGGKNSGSVGENEAAEKGADPSFQASQEKAKETRGPASSTAVIADGPGSVASGSTGATCILPSGSAINRDVTASPTGANKPGSTESPVNVDKVSTIAVGTGDACGEPLPTTSNSSVSVTSASSSTACFSSSDPVLTPSNDSWLPSAVVTIKREVEGHCVVNESNADVPAEKSASGVGALFMQGKTQSKSQGVVKSHHNESFQASPALVHGGSSGGRPSSNYTSRSQPIMGSQKAGTAKEWKPKPPNPNLPLGSAGSSDATNFPVEASDQSLPESSVLDSEATSKLQKKLEELHLPPRQHVIIPNHIHVPESERTKLSFGSFDANFGITSTFVSAPESDKSSTPLSETSEAIEDTVEEHAASALVANEEGSYTDHPQAPSKAPGNLSVESDGPSNSVADYNESKQENTLLPGGHQYSVVQTSPSYSFGFMPPVLGSQIAAFENSESQGRDVSCLPSFVGGNSLVLSTGAPTPLVTQAAGLMQSSIAVTQQPVPVFRPPGGLHISHYPPNYLPYGHYFPPFYVPPPGIHQFLSNGAFPQQPQAGGVYPAPPAAGATGVKYSVPQFKPGTNTGNSNHIGVATGYGPYGSSAAGYNPNSTAAGGNSTANEDLGNPQFKESNVYLSGQQSEGPAVWIAAPGRDISGLPASSFYNLPPQGQHVTFAPTQAGHSTFASIYHPGQAVTAAAVHPLMQQSQGMAGAVDMVGPAASVYQQAQHQQINWPNY